MILEKTDVITDGSIIYTVGDSNTLSLVLGIDGYWGLENLDHYRSILKDNRIVHIDTTVYYRCMTLFPYPRMGSIDALPTSLPFLSDALQYVLQNPIYDNVYSRVADAKNNTFYKVKDKVFQAFIMKYMLMYKNENLLSVSLYRKELESLSKVNQDICDFIESILHSHLKMTCSYEIGNVYFMLSEVYLKAMKYLGNNMWLNLGQVALVNNKCYKLQEHFLDEEWHMSKNEIRNFKPKRPLYIMEN